MRYLLILTFVLWPESSRLVFFTPAHLLHFGQDFIEVLFQVQVSIAPALHELPEFVMIVFRASPIFVASVDVLPKKTVHSLGSASKTFESSFFRHLFNGTRCFVFLFFPFTQFFKPVIELVSVPFFLCGVRGSGRVAKLLAAHAEVRQTSDFRSGTFRRRRRRRECGVKVTVREQQGRRMKHEKGEGEMERCDMRTAKHLEPYVHAMSVRHAQKLCQKNVRETRSVCTPPVTHTH